MSTKNKRIMPLSVQVYFTGRDAVLQKRIKALKKKYGVTESAIASMAIRAGLPLVKKNLDNLNFDLEFQAQENAKGDEVFTSKE